LFFFFQLHAAGLSEVRAAEHGQPAAGAPSEGITEAAAPPLNRSKQFPDAELEKEMSWGYNFIAQKIGTSSLRASKPQMHLTRRFGNAIILPPQWGHTVLYSLFSLYGTPHHIVNP
jgi:hypothetical protein